MKNNKWFTTLPGRENQTATVVFFPYAGGGVNSYRAWREYLPPYIGMSVLQMPGRDARINEPFEKDFRIFSKKIALAIHEHESMDKLIFFFGHSLGAVLAFEVARALEKMNYYPSALFLSGRRAAHISSPVRYHTWSDDDLILMLREMAGTSQEFLENETLMSIYLPIIRSDLRMLESYSYDEGEKTNIDIIALAGRMDILSPPEEVKEWRRNTRGNFIFKEYQGDHFFINSNKKEILKYIGTVVDLYVNYYRGSLLSMN